MSDGGRGRARRALPRCWRRAALAALVAGAPFWCPVPPSTAAAASARSVASVAGGTLPASAQTVRVETAEFVFRPAVIAVSAGRPVRLVFANRGRLAHQFQADYLRALPARIWDDATLAEVQGVTLVRVEPAGTASIEFYPRRRGRFVFACTIEGHREAGMRGVLEVK